MHSLYSLIVMLSLFAFSSMVHAQTPAPSPAAQDYVLRFSPGVSKALADSIKLGPSRDIQTTASCKSTVAADGAILCIVADTCDPRFPACGIFFSGPSGIELSDVAELAEISTSDVPAGMGISVATSNESDLRSKLEALKSAPQQE